MTGTTLGKIWTGTAWHDRRRPQSHRFQHRIWWADLDVDQLASLAERSSVLSSARFRPLRVRRADYFGDPSLDLGDTVRDLVEQRTGDRPDGPIRLLAHLRTFGWCFNPIALYFCHDRDGILRRVVADVTNTPWGERHQYVLPATGDGVQDHTEAKSLHVSPFMGMDQRYRFNIDHTPDRLRVRIDTIEGDEIPFSAGVDLQARPMTDLALVSTMARHPLLTMRVSLAIHTQAVRLWRKGVPIHRHPDRRQEPQEAPT